MKYKPHNYQKRATEFIEQNPICALFLDMGMGKTVTTLTAIDTLTFDAYQVEKTLIIAPLRVARDTWPQEINKWAHLGHLRTSTLVGTATQRANATKVDADIYIINRENLPWLVEYHGKRWPYDMVVIDELSSFKNHQTKRFKALKKVRTHIKRIVGLTGTPAPNSLIDLWAPFRLLDQGERLGKYITHYRDRYFLPDKRNGQRIFTWKIRPGAEEEIYNQIGDVTMSMKAADYLELPPVTILDKHLTLTPEEQHLYNQLAHDMITTVGSHTIDAPSAGVLAGKLMQLASGAIYVNEPGEAHDVETTTIHQHKLDALADIVEAANGNTLLVAYWFQHEKHRILEEFPQARALETGQDFQRWNEGRIPIGLIHPASAGHGLNLQAGGHIMVWFTTTWSSELYDQTNARLNRQGQTKPVTIIRLITKNTIDERVPQVLADKTARQTALIDAVKAQLT